MDAISKIKILRTSTNTRHSFFMYVHNIHNDTLINIVYVYTYMHIMYMHVCMYVCVCARACVCVCMYACMHACMYVRMYVCMHACTGVCTAKPYVKYGEIQHCITHSRRTLYPNQFGHKVCLLCRRSL